MLIQVEGQGLGLHFQASSGLPTEGVLSRAYLLATPFFSFDRCNICRDVRCSRRIKVQGSVKGLGFGDVAQGYKFQCNRL
jgi:hypothetical protein